MNTITMCEWYNYIIELMNVRMGIMPLYMNFPVYMDSHSASMITASRTIQIAYFSFS